MPKSCSQRGPRQDASPALPGTLRPCPLLLANVMVCVSCIFCFSTISSRGFLADTQQTSAAAHLPDPAPRLLWCLVNRATQRPLLKLQSSWKTGSAIVSGPGWGRAGLAAQCLPGCPEDPVQAVSAQQRLLPQAPLGGESGSVHLRQVVTQRAQGGAQVWADPFPTGPGPE